MAYIGFGLHVFQLFFRSDARFVGPFCAFWAELFVQSLSYVAQNIVVVAQIGLAVFALRCSGSIVVVGRVHALGHLVMRSPRPREAALKASEAFSSYFTNIPSP